MIRRITEFGVWVLLATTVACGGGGGGGGSRPADPDPDPTFDYSIGGSAVKGVIAGATVSVIDGDGNPVAGATATSNADGSFTIDFSTTAAVVEPVQLSLDGTGATTICDVSPTCEYGVDGNGDALIANFGDTHTLPDGFTMRSTITDLSVDGDDRSGTAFISPLSEFVTALALDMGDGTTLTATNLGAANEQVVAFLQEIYPTLDVGQLTEVSQVPLIDITDLETAVGDDFTELSLVVSSVASGVAALVDAESATHGTISDVINELSEGLIANQQVDGVFLGEASDLLLGTNAVAAVGNALGTLDQLLDDSLVVLPDSVGIEFLDDIFTAAEAILPELIHICTNLVTGEHTSAVESAGTGWADITLVPETGRIIINVDTNGIDVTAMHLHQGYAGANGPIIVGLEQDGGNDDRWGSPADTILDADEMAAVLRGETYINVHTAANPSGELRGQLVAESVLLVVAQPRGEEQVPAQVESAGFARAAITLDEDTGTGQVHLTSSIDLTAAHIHSGSAGTNGGVVVPMALDAASPGHWFADDVDFSDLVDQLHSGQLYFNLHTADHPAGELRAQVTPMGVQVLISTLDPFQQPSDEPVVSDATGVSAVTLDLGSGQFSIHVNTMGVEDATAAHIHTGAQGINGDALYTLVQSDADVNHWSSEGEIFTAAELVSFLEGGMYVNVHTPAYPAGEIRGQLTSVAPGSGDGDGDGVIDREDEFPEDPAESVDTDQDGTGDNADDFPTDPAEQTDSDNDGVGDNADDFPQNDQETTDTDGDGVGDNADACPDDPAETADSDGDGICDNSDPVDNSQDADGDGVPDGSDDFPNDPNESQDSDGDGVGDNADEFPNDSGETVDTDGDGVGDNADEFPADANESQDSDGDGVGDNADAFPNDANETLDTDDDGTGDNADAFPTDPAETTDTDDDGVGDNGDNCPNDANPNQENSDGEGPGDACEVADAPTFTDVQAIFTSRCVVCHGSSGGLSLAASGSYENIVNVASSEIPSLDRIEPGEPDNSYLIWKIEGREGIEGARMPFGGPFLSEETIDEIRAWVEAGALDN